MSNLLEAKNLSKFYKEGNEEIKAVNNINFSIKENEKVAELIIKKKDELIKTLPLYASCLLYTSPSPRDRH